jgi:NADH-quinone oxidoreductase subunit L
MIVAALPILAPLAAVAAILLARRAPSPLAILGAVVGTAAAVSTLVGVARGARYAATLPGPLGLPGLPLRLVVDPLAAVLQVTVAVVTLCVLVYAVGYMRRYGDHARFFAAMSFFAAAMQTLALAGDWVLFLAAYELIGLASYLLIGFWYARPEVPRAATRAFVITRAADLGLYLSIFVLATRAGTTAIAPTLRVGGQAATAAALLLLVAAMGKAGQVPFQGWLQDAMRGPTPVSALLHAATLVIAGVILLARALPLFPPGALLLVGAVGGVTAVVAGLMAIAQGDLKRLLAASTSSQLGFMFLALGAGSVGAALAHLVAHAAMKGALFLGAGVYQEAYDSTAFDDLRGAARAHRATYVLVAVAGLAVAGIPPLAGFWSKDAVVAATLAAPSSGVLAPLALVATLLTGGYVGRALRLLWRGDAREAPVAGIGWMFAGLAVLAVLAATLGLAVGPIAALLGLPLPENALGVWLDLAAAVAGVLAGGLFPIGRLFGPARTWAATGFRVGGGFDGLVARPAFALALQADRADSAIHRGVLGVGRAALAVAHAARVVDERGIDGLIWALVAGVRELGVRARTLQTGLVSRELVFTLGGVTLVVAVLLVVR